MTGKRARATYLLATAALCALVVFLAGLAIATSPQQAIAVSPDSNKTYKIVYKLDGGTQAAGQVFEVKSGEKVYVSSLKKPKKKGYVFKGWYRNASLTKKARYVKGDSKASSRTLYAKWKPQKYKITYKLRGGSLSGSYAKKYTYGVGKRLATPTRNGYDFVGWYTNTTWSKQVKSISKTARGDKVVYARWKKATYNISYKLNGGYFTGEYPTEYKYKKGTALPEPQRDGYVFIGWYKNSKLTKPINEIGTADYGDKKLYARWQKRLVIAHRGFHETYPENSYDSYIDAEDKGFSYVETDVRFTSDGVPVLYHDADIPIVIAGDDLLLLTMKTPISTMTYAELQTAQLGIDARGPHGTNVTTFDEFMELCAQLGLHPVVDIKDGTEQQIAKLVNTVDKYGMQEFTSWTSFSAVRLGYVAKRVDGARVSITCHEITNTIIKRALKLRGQGAYVTIGAKSSDLTSSMVDLCKANHIPLGVWPIADETVIPSLDPYIFRYSIDGLEAEEAPTV